MKITDDVLTELSLAQVSADGRELVLTRQIDRKLYTATNKVLTELGGKWSRKQAAHVFTSDIRPQLEAALSSGEVATRADFGFFQTPEPLATRLVELAQVRRGIDRCLEPSAGMGRIVTALVAAGGHVTAIERHDVRRGLLESRFVGQSVTVEPDLDFMMYMPPRPFDRVVMNPPFVRCGLGDYIDHVYHAWSMLAPGGRLVAILPADARSREDRRHREFRAWLDRGGTTIEDLPDGSFKESGTDVRTCVAVLEA